MPAPVAICRAYVLTGAGPTFTDVDANDADSFTFGRDDLVASAASASIPPIATAPGTRFSARKTLVLYVTSGGGTTSLAERTIALGADLPVGLSAWFMPIASYTQNTLVQGTTAGDYPANQSTDAATPADPADGSYTLLSTGPQTWDSSTVAATDSTVNGLPVVVILARDSTYAGPGGLNPMVDIVFDWLEL